MTTKNTHSDQSRISIKRMSDEAIRSELTDRRIDFVRRRERVQQLEDELQRRQASKRRWGDWAILTTLLFLVTLIVYKLIAE